MYICICIYMYICIHINECLSFFSLPDLEIPDLHIIA